VSWGRIKLAHLDKDKILRYKAEIREDQNVLAQITSEDAADFIRDPLKIRALKYTLIVLVEAICNLCRHVLAKKAYILIEEYMEAILKMQEKAFLSEKIAGKLIPFTRLRHQLIQGYWKTDDRRLFIETKENLKTIDEFLSEIDQFLSHA
jgi:uncharacterized protein YutE (UPF0331/DUF86 family)